MDDQVLVSGGWRRGRRFEDLGAALGCDCETGARVEVDGEVDVVAGYEAAAISEEEEQRDFGGSESIGISFVSCQRRRDGRLRDWLEEMRC